MLALNMASDLTFSQPIQDPKYCDQDILGYLESMIQGLPFMQTVAAFPLLARFHTSRFGCWLVEKIMPMDSGIGYIYK